MAPPPPDINVRQRKKPVSDNETSPSSPEKEIRNEIKGKLESRKKEENEKAESDSLVNVFYVVSVFAFLTRFVGIGYPSEVVFDEVHFGKFASFYITGEYYFDLHPPLGKMLLALVGYIFGFDGKFKFETIGDDYIANKVPYVSMRMTSAFCGVFVILLSFGILRELKVKSIGIFLACSMIIFDNALMCITRLILLDGLLMNFIMFSAYCWIKFYKTRKEPFSRKWWQWLLLTGIGIGCTTSVKMVGLFTITLIGIATLFDLWRLLDVKAGLSVDQFIRHFNARAICLIVVPILIYLGSFYVHFQLLTESGPGNDFMSPDFQATLNGSSMSEAPHTVYYGAHVKIKNYDDNIFLHSHLDRYPLNHEDKKISSAGQQVTGYSHPDDNNYWIITPGTDDKISELAGKQVKDGDVVRFEHWKTASYLLTHDVASPLTMSNMEMTCWPKNNTEKPRHNETLWTIKVASGPKNIETKRSILKIRHFVQKVYLNNHKKNLPKWGFEQREINGARAGDSKQVKWYFDSVKEVRDLPNLSKFTLKSMGFWPKYGELQVKMFQHNANLRDDHPFASNPFSWPLVLRGVSFWQHKDTNAQIYFLGNLGVWYLVNIAMLIFASFSIVDAIFVRRGIDNLGSYERYHYLMGGGFLAGAYATHFFPFFLMGRVLFLHHYLPSVIFGSLVTGYLFDFFYGHLPIRNQLKYAAPAIAIIFFLFIYFLPFTVGSGLSESAIMSRQWMKSWDFGFLPASSDS